MELLNSDKQANYILIDDEPTVTSNSPTVPKTINVRDINSLKQTNQIRNMSELLQSLLYKRLISDYEYVLLENSSSSCAKELFKSKQANKLQNYQQLTPVIKSFAQTLHYLSPTAYEYCRGLFDGALPYPHKIGIFCNSFGGTPGFTNESFATLKSVASDTNQRMLCSLVMDEVTINRHLEWDGKNMHGYVDLGNDMLTDTSVEATEVLVFMLVSINASWKLPVAYFLTSSLTGPQKCTLVRECIKKAAISGVQVVSISFNCAPSNISMAKALGCSLDGPKVKPWFTWNKCKIFVFYDACHMLKLIRTAICEKQVLNCSNGKQIKWQYIQALNELQLKDGLLASNFRQSHLPFLNQKLKVKLATELLSDSVADSLEFCLHTLELPQFEGCEETIHFIRTINICFDILNSRNIVSPDFKKPICTQNIAPISNFIRGATSYLKEIDFGIRKTGIHGFIIDLENCVRLFHEYVESQTSTNLSTYKLSQYHLEFFFSSLKSTLGFTSNPTARQFQDSYKTLLIKAEILDPRIDKCESSVSPQIPTVNSSLTKINNTTQYHLVHSQSDYEGEDVMPDLSIRSESIVFYIAEFIVKRLLKKMKCGVCMSAVLGNEASFDGLLIAQKISDGLAYPSMDVLKIVKFCEQIFKTVFKLNKKKSIQYLTTQVLTNFIGENLFDDLYTHMFDTSVEANHFILLLKTVCEEYFRVRLKFVVKQKNHNRLAHLNFLQN